MTPTAQMIRAGASVRAATAAMDHADTYEAIVEAAAAYTTAWNALRAMQAERTIEARAAAVSERAGKFNAIKEVVTGRRDRSAMEWKP